MLNLGLEGQILFLACALFAIRLLVRACITDYFDAKRAHFEYLMDNRRGLRDGEA